MVFILYNLNASHRILVFLDTEVCHISQRLKTTKNTFPLKHTVFSILLRMHLD